MDNLGGRQYFSILNQGKANHQIYLSPGSRHVTAIISYHIISYIFPYITFIYYKNMQICCINIFLVLNNKVNIGFWNEEGLAKSRYGFVIKPLLVNRVLRTHGWNIFKKYVISLLKESSLCFNSDLKRGIDSFSFSEFWRKLFQIESPLNEILNLLLLSPVLGIL